MGPRLQRILPPDRRCEARAPLLSRKSFRHTLNRRDVDELRLTTHVIKDGGELDQSLDTCNCPLITEVLMANDCLGHILSLLLWSAESAQEFERYHATVELERQQRSLDVLIGCADIVQHRGQEVGLDERGRRPVWEGVLKYGNSVVEDPHAVVKGLGWQLALRVLVHGSADGRGGQRDRRDRHCRRVSRNLKLLEESGGLPGDSCPAVLLDCGVAHGCEDGVCYVRFVLD